MKLTKKEQKYIKLLVKYEDIKKISEKLKVNEQSARNAFSLIYLKHGLCGRGSKTKLLEIYKEK